MLEYSVMHYDRNHPDPRGNFLQVSGITVLYDIRQKPGSRVKELRVATEFGQDEKEHRAVEDDKVYEVVLSAYMVSGGDGYTMINPNLEDHRPIGLLDKDLCSSYIQKLSPIQTLPSEGRISFIHATEPSAASTVLLSNFFVLLSILIQYSL